MTEVPEWRRRCDVGSGLLDLALILPGTCLLLAAGVDWSAMQGEPILADHDRVQGDAVGLTLAGGVLLVAGIVGVILTRPLEQDTVVKADGP